MVDLNGIRAKTSGGVLVRMLSPVGGGHWIVCQWRHWASKGVDIEKCASEDASPGGGGHRAVCQRERWALKGWTSDDLLARTLGPEGEWIVRSHINWRGKRNIYWKGVRTLSPERDRHRAVCQRGCWAPKGIDCEISHRLVRGTKHCLQESGNLSQLEGKPRRKSLVCILKP